MGKLFGTDGIRGVANETLDAKLAYRVGQAAAISLCDDSGTKPTVVIGKDTRISSDMLEGALVAGLTACGCNAILLGVIPTCRCISDGLSACGRRHRHFRLAQSV